MWSRTLAGVGNMTKLEHDKSEGAHKGNELYRFSQRDLGLAMTYDTKYLVALTARGKDVAWAAEKARV